MDGKGVAWSDFVVKTMVDFSAGWSNLGLIYALNSFLFWFLSGLLFMSFQWLEERGHNIACYKSFQNFLERHHRWVLSSLFCMDLSLFTLFFSSLCNHQMPLLFYLIECRYIGGIRMRGQWMEKALVQKSLANYNRLMHLRFLWWRKSDKTLNVEHYREMIDSLTEVLYEFRTTRSRMEYFHC